MSKYRKVKNIKIAKINKNYKSENISRDKVHKNGKKIILLINF